MIIAIGATLLAVLSLFTFILTINFGRKVTKQTKVSNVLAIKVERLVDEKKTLVQELAQMRQQHREDIENLVTGFNSKFQQLCEDNARLHKRIDVHERILKSTHQSPFSLKAVK